MKTENEKALGEERQIIIANIALEVRELISQGLSEPEALLQALERSLDRTRDYQIRRDNGHVPRE